MADHTTVPGGALTAAGLSRLLGRLHPDRDTAAHEYERLHRALVRFFDWRGASSPEECADATIDRVARRLEEGVTIDDLASYARGVARLVLLERLRAPVLVPLDPQAGMADLASATDPGEVLHDCFDSCLGALPPDSRSLVVQYYQGERRAKIVQRRGLASTLGLSDNALRSRVQRIRDRLEACVHACIASRGGL